MEKRIEEMLVLHGAEKVMKAHQYLYYVDAEPIISDRDYDQFCDKHGMFGGGGSDSIEDYSLQETHIARYMKVGM